MENKYCKRCKQTKPIKDFYKCQSQDDRHTPYCKECVKLIKLLCKKAKPDYYRAYAREYHHRYKKTTQGRCSRLRNRALSVGISFEISNKDFILWFEGQPKTCHYCGQALESGNGSTTINSLNIDRKDNLRGYTLDNIVLACRRCNCIKGNWLTYQQMREIAQKYFQI